MAPRKWKAATTQVESSSGTKLDAPVIPRAGKFEDARSVSSVASSLDIELQEVIMMVGLDVLGYEASGAAEVVNDANLKQFLNNINYNVSLFHIM